MLQPEVKSQAMEMAELIENEDGVATAVDAFHQYLTHELPMPPSSMLEEDDGPNTVKWFFVQIGKICCRACS